MTISADFLSVLLGVVSGIVTAILIGLATLLFKHILIPWFQQLVYQGVNVGGNWHHKAEFQLSATTTQQFEVFLDIEQQAHKVTGNFHVRNVVGGTEYTNYYKLKGVVKDNYLQFTYTAQRSDRTGLGSFLLRVAHGGTKLIGSAIFTPDADPNDTSVAVRRNMIFKRE